MVFTLSALKSQTYSYEFEYDDSGNRTRRTVITIPPGQAVQQEDENSLNEEKEQVNELSEQFFGEKTITVYPNPTTGIITLEINPLEQNDRGYLSLYSVDGSLLIQEEIIGENSEIDLSDLYPGSYLLNISLNDHVKTYKIVRK
jgi:hypothetical protein